MLQSGPWDLYMKTWGKMTFHQEEIDFGGEMEAAKREKERDISGVCNLPCRLHCTWYLDG